MKSEKPLGAVIARRPTWGCLPICTFAPVASQQCGASPPPPMRCIRPQLLYIYLYVGLLTVVLCRVLRLGCLQRPLAVTLPPHLLQHRRLKPAAAAATTSAHAAPCSPAPGTQENIRIQENCSPCRRRCHRRRPARQLLRGRRARRRRGLKGEQWGTGRLCPPASGRGS